MWYAMVEPAWKDTDRPCEICKGIRENDVAIGIKTVSILTVDVLEFGGGGIGSEV